MIYKQNIMQIISNKVFHSYSGKIKYLDCVDSKIIYITDKELSVLWLDGTKQQQLMNVHANHIIKVSAGANGLIAILYSNNTLQVRRLSKLDEVVIKFTKVEYNTADGYPKISWQKQQIYLIYRTMLQVISLARKQRKAYNDIINSDEKDRIEDIALSNVISKQKIAILQFHHKLTFNIIPIPITQVIIKNINQIKNLTHPVHENQNTLDRQYLMVIMENNRLHIYNVINMKLLVEIIYENQNNDRMRICSDNNNEFIVLQFSNVKSGKVTKNILYKVNTNYYYTATSDYFNEEECFFDFEIQISVKEKLGIFSVNTNENSTSLYLNYVNKSKKEIKLIYLKIPKGYKNKIKSHIKMDPKWKEVREWKQIITSYVQMKNSLQKLDFELNEPNQIATLSTQPSSSSKLFSEQYPNQLDKFDSYEDDFKEIQKYEKLNNQLEEAAYKFQSNYKVEEIMDNSDENHEKRIQQQFYKFMRGYLKEQQLDVDPEKFFQIEFESASKKDSKYIEVQDEDDVGIVLSLPKQKRPARQSKIRQKQIQAQKKQKQKQQEVEVVQCEFDQQKQQFDKKLSCIENSIMKAFAPLEQKVQKLSEKLDKYEGLHIKQLRKCVNMVQEQKNKTQNINSTVHGYCKEVMSQFNNSLDNCLQSYWYKVQETDRKGRKEREKTLNEFGKHIDQQIKSREYIFDSSRLTIDNHLSHLRKKIVETFIDDEDEQFWEQEEKNVQQQYFGFYKPKI